jgi:hypothetical protein
MGFMRDRSFREVGEAHQPLRQRMIDDMTVRWVKEKVQKDYVRHVRTFAAFLGRSPDTATSEDLRRFQVHLAQRQIGVATINAAIAALRFFFNVTLERPDLVRHLTTVNQPRRAPVVLSQEELARLLEAAPGLKVKATLSVAYGADVLRTCSGRDPAAPRRYTKYHMCFRDGRDRLGAGPVALPQPRRLDGRLDRPPASRHRQPQRGRQGRVLRLVA